MHRLVAVIVGLGVVSIGLVEYQRAVFDSNVSALQAEMSSLAAIDAALLQLDPVLPGVLYGIGGAHEQAVTDYEEVRASIDAAFNRASRSMTSADAGQLLAVSRASWAAMDSNITTAIDEDDTAAVQAAVARGEDPFAQSVWGHDTMTNRTMSALRTQSVVDLQSAASKVRALRRVTLPAIAAVLGLSVIVAMLSWRRMTHAVIRPLSALRLAAERLRGLEPSEPSSLAGGVVEVQRIAEALDETAHALRQAHQRLQVRAATDALTDLPNRQGFTEWIGAGLDTGSSVALLFVDLDDFKAVNDSLGHPAGDVVLQTVAGRLRGCVRGDACVARLGGDEFAIAVRGARDDELRAIGERIVEALRGPIAVGHRRAHVGCSVGIARADPGIHDDGARDELLGRADAAMYEAKRTGKNRVVLDRGAPPVLASVSGLA